MTPSKPHEPAVPGLHRDATHAWRLGAKLLLVLTFAVGFSPRIALAQAQAEAVTSYPSRYTERPLTLPALHLRVEPQVSLWISNAGSEDEVVLVLLNGGVGFGIIDDLEVGLGTSPIAPLMASASFQGGLAGLGGALTPAFVRGFLSPTFYARYRFAALPQLETGLELAVAVPANGRDVGIIFGVPLRVRGGDHFALDASVTGLVVPADDDVYGVLLVTLMPRFAWDTFYVGLNTGVMVPLDYPEDTHIPLLFEAGATLPVGAAVLDTYVRAGLPFFVNPGADGDKVVTELWELSFGVRAHIGLGAD